MRGEPGTPGPRGDTGAQGPRGADGLDGLDGFDGDDGAAGAPGVGLNGFLGYGSNGDATVDGPSSLTRDTYYDDLTLAPGASLNTGGYRLFVAGTLAFGTGARIDRDGNPGNQGFGGATLAPGTLGGAGRGSGNACGPAAEAMTNSLGGHGGGSLFCGAAIFTAGPELNNGGFHVFRNALAAVSGRTLDGLRVNGGSGGRGGNFTGGGSGGGVVVVVARTVSAPGVAAISANGGNSSGTDSAGGGGGVVVVISTSPKPAALTLSAAPGTNGNPVATAGFTAWLN